MRELTSVVLEMERHGKRLRALLRVGRLNTMNRDEFHEMVAIVDRLMVNFTDFNVLHFSPRSLRRKLSASRERTRKAKGLKSGQQ